MGLKNNILCTSFSINNIKIRQTKTKKVPLENKKVYPKSDLFTYCDGKLQILIKFVVKKGDHTRVNLNNLFSHK